MAGNRTLSARNRAALDEWYTQLVDIEAELRHYRDQFRDKVVFLQLRRPIRVELLQILRHELQSPLGLKKLLTTSYAGSPISGEQLPLLETAGLRDTQPPREPYKVEISEVHDLNQDGAIDLLDVERLLRHDANVLTPMAGDGDFRSKECVALLDESDIVVTNPPFFAVSGVHQPADRQGKELPSPGRSERGQVRLDLSPHRREQTVVRLRERRPRSGFAFPDDYEIKTESRKKLVDGVKFQSMGRIYWYTNLDTTKRHEPLTLYKRYTAEEYPAYTNYPAIEVAKVAEIPMDYDGEMGRSDHLLGQVQTQTSSRSSESALN